LPNDAHLPRPSNESEANGNLGGLAHAGRLRRISGPLRKAHPADNFTLKHGQLCARPPDTLPAGDLLTPDGERPTKRTQFLRTIFEVVSVIYCKISSCSSILTRSRNLLIAW